MPQPIRVRAAGRQVFRGLALVIVAASVAGCGADRGDSPLASGRVAAAADSNPSAPADSSGRAAEENADSTDWAMFLGPHGSGVSNESGFASSWPKEGPRVVWSKEIGAGYGAPSICGDRLVVHHRIIDRRASDEIIECLDAATGEPQWRFAYPSRFSDPYGYNPGPRCTPLLTGEHCYTLGAEGKLVCVTLEAGEKVWMRDLKQEFDIPDWFFGMGCSPILVDGRLIVLVGGQPNSGVVAFAPPTGKTLWESVGRATWDGVETGWPNRPRYDWEEGEQIVSYSSPITATIHGRNHLLCLMRQGLVSLDPADGRVRFKHFFRSIDHESVNAARPLVIGNRIFITAAYGLGSALLEVAEDGESCKVVWQNRRNMLAHWSTPIHVGGYIYGFSGRHENEGELRCIDLETGRVVWQTSGYEGDLGRLRLDPATGRIVDVDGQPMAFPFYGRGSKILAGDQFIVLGERGTLALVKVNSAKWEELARTSVKDISYPAWAAPVLSRGRLYLRDEDSLVCLELPKVK